MNLTTTDFTCLTATRQYQAPRKHELPDTYGKGRACVEEGCETRSLSIYNPGPACYLHTPKWRRIMLARDGEGE
jgi:hypothetical protein